MPSSFVPAQAQTCQTSQRSLPSQEVDVYGLPLGAPANQGSKVRSYLASQGGHGDADILRSLRGNSLDTLSSVQRQLAGLPPQVRRMTDREQIMEPHFGTVRLSVTKAGMLLPRNGQACEPQRNTVWV